MSAIWSINGTCAGGTGAFIDQMATLLNVKLEDMDELAKQHEKTYTIASRCGVFAKTDIQPLLNQGARKSDIAESIFNAVVSQTVAGLAQGREIEGQIVYLGGPLTFMSELRNCFDRTLGTKGICPENSLYYVPRKVYSARKSHQKPTAHIRCLCRHCGCPTAEVSATEKVVLIVLVAL